MTNESDSKMDAETAEGSAKPESAEPILQKKQEAQKRPGKEITFSNNLALKVNCLNLAKNVKGILVHNGYFYVTELMKHFQRTEISQAERQEGQLPFEIVQVSDIKTDPKLDTEQVESVIRELERMYDLYDQLMAKNPLHFSFDLQQLPPEMGRRRYISLMKELTYKADENAYEEPEDNFLDIIFGIGEVTELCGLNSTGKTQICF